MSTPTLSVVIPNYNHGKYLPACLQAILNQSFAAKEIVVVDDASTDNSVEVLEQFARQHPNLRYFRNETNQKVLITVNRGLEKVSGDYVALLAADDEVCPGFFEKTISLLAQHPQAALCGGICQFEDVDTKAVYRLGVGMTDKPRYFSPDELVDLSRRGKLMMFTSVMVFRREALLKAGKYQLDLKWHADWFGFVVAAFRDGVCFVPEVLGVFRVMSGGYSKKGMRQRKDQCAVLESILKHLEEPQFADVAPRLRDASAFACFGKEMLGLLLFNRRYWKYLTAAYIRQALWWTIRIEAKKILPAWAAKLYFKLSGASAHSA